MVRERAGDVIMTDGPYLEGKEHVGGLLIVTAPDLDAALGYAAARRGPPGCPSRSGRSRMPPSTEPGAGAIGIREIEGVFRAEYGRAVAVLTRVFGSIDVAEDAVQEAFAAAVATWPAAGRPPARRAGSSPPPAAGPSTTCAARPPVTTGRPRRRSSTPVTSRPGRRERTGRQGRRGGIRA